MPICVDVVQQTAKAGRRHGGVGRRLEADKSCPVLRQSQCDGAKISAPGFKTGNTIGEVRP